MAPTPEQIQREFYAAHSDRYDELHVDPGDEHYRALTFISALVDGFGYSSLLDVGAGTGRGVKHVLERHPDVEINGTEPVREMIEQAERSGVPAGVIVESASDPLPFADQSQDAVFELGVLHHVADPDAIVREMARVARRAVFLSDENRFGRGSRAYRLLKFGLHKARLWPIAYRLSNRGRSYRVSAGDGGVAYSYSVYDSLPFLHEWADRVFLVPTGPSQPGWFHPAFGAHHILLCAIRDD